jgi:hypothetical protein
MTLLVVMVFFGATLVRSALGFGEALIAVPIPAFVRHERSAARDLWHAEPSSHEIQALTLHKNTQRVPRRSKNIV